jgi:plasmid stabilization system protein ParE
VEARFHKLVQADLNKILRDYSQISSQLEDDFYEEFMGELEKAVANPQSNHFDACGLRRANFNRFPFHFLYDVMGDSIRIWVLRHHRRKASLGLGRFKR